jgi:hypothetical protein
LFGTKGKSVTTGEVTFLREEKRRATKEFFDLATYRYYKAASTGEALEFLNKQKITEKLFYVAVETPDGRWIKDCTGLYDA